MVDLGTEFMKITFNSKQAYHSNYIQGPTVLKFNLIFLFTNITYFLAVGHFLSYGYANSKLALNLQCLST